MTPNKGQYFVYITTNKDHSSLNTGSTGDLGQRLYQLEYELVYGRDTPVRNDCVQLLYWEQYDDAVSAIHREEELKKWSRRKKTTLINTVNKEWRSLNEEILRPARSADQGNI